MHKRLIVKVKRTSEEIEDDEEEEQKREWKSEHVVFEDVFAEALHGCSSSGRQTLININYGKVSRDLISIDNNSTDFDGELFIVKISKKFFEAEIENPDES